LLTSTCCKKTLAGTNAPAVPPRPHAGSGHHGPTLVLAAVTPLMGTSVTSAAEGDLWWQSHRLPPPTDRVVAFQHFII
jgi:hypothetical protein